MNYNLNNDYKLDDMEKTFLDELLFDKIAELLEDGSIAAKNDIEVYKSILNKIK